MDPREYSDGQYDLEPVAESRVSRKGQVWDTDRGVPQGGIISPIIENLTLDGLQETVRKAVEPYISTATRKDGRYRTMVSVIRYADDFIVSSAREELLVDVIKPAIENFLEPRGLRMSPKKSVITNLRDGFDFLGFNIRVSRSEDKAKGSSDILLMKPSERSLENLRQKLSRMVRHHGSGPEIALISKLNPLLRGWANYARIGVAKRAFVSIDHHPTEW